MSPRASAWNSDAATPRRAWRRSSAALAGLLAVAACTPPVRQYALRDLKLSCDEANRATYRALNAMGFAVTAFTPATPAQPGQAKATREATEAGLVSGRVTVTIDCGPAGTAIDASEDGKWLGQLEFKRAFFLSFTGSQAMEERRREMDTKIAQGQATAPEERQGLQVLIEPIRGHAAKLDFDLDLAAAGVLPVRVRVVNPTAQRYTLSPDEVQLTRTDRTRVAPLPTQAAVARITEAKDPQTGTALTALSATALTERLGRLRFTATDIAPRSEAHGYLYYPLAEYRRARVVLTEAGSEEAEGFVVEF